MFKETITAEYALPIIQSIFQNWLFKAVGTVILIVCKFIFDIELIVPMVSLLVLIILDFVTGVIKAFKTGEGIKSRKMVRSAVKVSEYFIFVAAANVSEYGVPFAYIDDTVIGFLVLTEFKSIMENLASSGVPIPKKLFRIINKYRDAK